ncbi:hypothetical protein EJB05_28615, partial [Eragrostis curvula]
LCIHGATSKAHGEVTYQYLFFQDARKQSPWTKDLPIRCKREIKIEGTLLGPKNVTWKVHPLLAEPGRDYRANKQLRQVFLTTFAPF